MAAGGVTRHHGGAGANDPFRSGRPVSKLRGRPRGGLVLAARDPVRVPVLATLISWDAWREYGGGSPKPALYGIWTVTEFVRDGVVAPPLTTDDERWQRLVFDTGEAAAVQKMDGTLQPLQAEGDAEAGQLRLNGGEAGTFSLVRPGDDELRLSGTVADQPVRMRLERTDPASFTLLNRGFQWVQEYPYFR